MPPDRTASLPVLLSVAPEAMPPDSTSVALRVMPAPLIVSETVVPPEKTRTLPAPLIVSETVVPLEKTRTLPPSKTFVWFAEPRMKCL